jgi:hypothetical protein
MIWPLPLLWGGSQKHANAKMIGTQQSLAIYKAIFELSFSIIKLENAGGGFL